MPLEQCNQSTLFTQKPPNEKRCGTTPSPKTIRFQPLGSYSINQIQTQTETETQTQTKNMESYCTEQYPYNSILQHSNEENPNVNKLFQEEQEHFENHILDLNNYIIFLRSQIEQQTSVIDFQDKAIDRQHDMIKAMQESLRYSAHSY